MSTEDIKKLIAAFYNGETSIEEEKLLYRYFNSDDVAEELICEKEYFLQIQNIGQTPIPIGFTDKIDELFDNLERKEKSRKKLWISIASAAAIVAIFFVGYHWTNSDNIDNRLAAIADTIQIESNIISHTSDTIEIEKTERQTVEKVIIKNSIIAEKKTVHLKVKTNKDKEQLTEKELEDYKKMKEALELVSNNLEKGLEQLSTVSDELLRTKELSERRINIKNI